MKIIMYFLKEQEKGGGGYIQAIKTADGLSKLGHSVRLELISNNSSFDLTTIPQADIHHFFGFHSVSLAKHIKRYDKGLIAISTIWWWTPAVQRVITPFGFKYCRSVLGGFIRKKMKNYLKRYDLIKMADILLPNSPREGDLIKKYFPISPDTLICPVPNGVDPLPAEIPSSSVSSSFPTNYLLCAGAFNRRKNQLAVVRAMRTTDVPVIFLGSPAKYGDIEDNLHYYKKCKDQASNKMFFVDEVEHRSPEWYSFFSRANGFVMASACETPSLAALEAALFGCNIAITKNGSAAEYFGAMAFYCDPLDPVSIRVAAERAFYTSKRDSLRFHIASKFLWSQACETTVYAYKAAHSKLLSDLDMYKYSVQDLWYEENQ